ncbi:MAG: isoprenylcysteine carboxylmethyltransferase family protein [Acidobacteria bacterium]|nr:isoprenylcysteine carboxylmethyltransferase family protein [Acidobacteriota bacterium]
MRGRLVPALGSLVFFFVAPGTVAGLVPWSFSRWRVQAPFFGWPATRVLGGFLLLTGAAAVIDCFARFALEARGTPAPVLPTERLVVSGLYRRVRNPMYCGVIAAVLGQALLLGNEDLLVYGAAVWAAFHAFVLLYEEPRLRARYGAEYEEYCRNVRRWWPRGRPWSASPSQER